MRPPRCWKCAFRIGNSNLPKRRQPGLTPPGRAPLWGNAVGPALPPPQARLWHAGFGGIVRGAVGRGPPRETLFPRAQTKTARGVSLAVFVLRRLLFRRLIILMKPHPATVLGDHPGQPVSIRRRRCGIQSTPVAVSLLLGERPICCRQWLTGRERPGYLLAYSGILQCKKIPPHEEGKGYSCEPRTFENTHLIG